MIQIGVIGGHTASPRHLEWARRIGRLIAEYPAVLVCGGLGGVMEAASAGAREAGGTTLGILPGDDRRSANPDISIGVATGMGIGRNIMIVRSSDLVFAIDGGPGTLSEIAYALQLKVPVLGLDAWKIDGVEQFDDPERAMERARKLLGNKP